MRNAALPVWLQQVYSLLFLLLPWTVDLEFGSWNLSIPAEPLLALAGIGMAYVLFRQKIPHLSALAWISVAWIGWMAVAALCSTMPLVSGKYWIVEAGHWWVFFGGLLCWPQLWPRVFRLFAWSMLGVIVYTLGHHAFHDFRANQAMLAPQPFFPDHTMYSAVLVMLLFLITQKTPVTGQWLLRGACLLALLPAASRGAWLSLLIAGIVGLALYWRLRWQWWLLAGAMAFVGILFWQGPVTQALAGDVSTRERLNRYSCAWRMAADRPLAGFGPGVFQFKFFAYQRPEEMTRISRTAPIEKRGPGNYGRGGGAHSEYLQALAELGWPGLAIWLLLAGGSAAAAAGRYRRTGSPEYLLLAMALLSFFCTGWSTTSCTTRASLP
ncbi:MAG: O-antigen ligase family protein [Saprospirales bacterium]|nr:O-antigen ligase family protein [Saprospirales bacterium]